MATLVLTGATGTVGTRVASAAARAGFEVVGWDRARVDPEDGVAGVAWLVSLRPAAIVHLALGSASWAGRLARFAGVTGIPFVFTSTAMVFDHQPDGPHAPGDPRTAKDDYGQAKIACEDAILAANPRATVLRIGWQIDFEGSGNNMVAALDAWQVRDGSIGASRLWTPACSFLADTADALVSLVQAPRPGVHHFDANAEEAHAFPEIVRALQIALPRPGWQVHENDSYRHDQRLVGGLVAPPLSARLPFLIRGQ